MTVPSFSERRKQLLAEREKAGVAPSTPAPPSPPTPQVDADLIPDVGDNRSEESKELDSVIESITIEQAYRKWSNKSEIKAGNKREGIKVSCPKPTHRDRDPSAWLNLDKNTWYCGSCEEGGDVYDIAAYNLGYDVPGYKNGATFHELREEMAEAFGYRFKKVAGGTVMWKEEEKPEPPKPVDQATPEPPTPAAPTPEQQNQTPEPLASVTPLYADDDDEEDNIIYPALDWREIVPEDTFLWEYMNECCKDDSPEEYHFWHALLALGHAGGRKTYLEDTRPVYPNLLLCLLGSTGVGKSKSRAWLDNVIREALPYKEDGSATTGTKIVPVPGSGEYLVSTFSYEGVDPSNPKRSLGPQPVNGIVDFDELSQLMSRGNRQGSSLKPTIMAFADCKNEVSIGGLQRGEYVAVEPFCSITATTQPRAIRTQLDRQDASTGFINRWVFASGPVKEKEILGGSRATTAPVNLDDATQKLKIIRGWAASGREVQLTDEAYDKLVDFYRNVVYPNQRADSSELISRIDLLVKKLILLFCINERLNAATPDIIDKVRVVYKYLIKTYTLLNQSIGMNELDEVMQFVLDKVKAHEAKTGRGASARDIVRYAQGRRYSTEQVKKVLDTLTQLDFLEIEKPNKGRVGRPVILYKAVGE